MPALRPRSDVPALLVLLAAAGCGDDAAAPATAPAAPGPVPLADQLARFAELGIVRNAGTSDDDLFGLHDRFALETRPFTLLAEAMARDIEREPWTPISDRLWMCDLERVEDDGAYGEVLLRLERMTGGALALANVEDHVDVEGGAAWVAFDLGGRRMRWTLRVEDDWLDPAVLAKYAALLQRSRSPIRLYGNFSDYGQSALLVALAPAEQARFTALTGIMLAPVE